MKTIVKISKCLGMLVICSAIISISFSTLIITRVAFAGSCGATSVTLDSSTYSAVVGATISVTETAVGSSSSCTNIIQDNTSGSFLIVPTTDTDLDCNGATCSATGPGPLT